jgi:hypothetical protein
MEDLLMRTLPLIAGAAAVALAGAGYAAAPRTHVMDVPLADGSVVHVEYVGDVAPKITLAPRPVAGPGWGMPPMPALSGIDQMIEQMNRETQAMIRQAQQMGRNAPAGAPGINVAAYGNAPPGMTSTTVVSVSNGGGTCTRTIETVSQGPGKPPRVTSNVTGNCGPSAAPQPQHSGLPIDHT